MHAEILLMVQRIGSLGRTVPQAQVLTKAAARAWC